MVVLAAGLKEVRVIGGQHGHNSRLPHVVGDRLLPDLDGPPWAPEEVEGATQDVVPRRHARKRARIVAVETQGTRREAVDVGRIELAAPVGTEQVAVQAVEEDDDRVLRASVGFGLGHGASLMQMRSGLPPRPWMGAPGMSPTGGQDPSGLEH